jgi:tRNA/rRNA methyltransferase
MTAINVCVVLVEPKGGGNIGSVSRVMKNFGYTDLRLVNPRVDHLGEESCNLAVTSLDLLKNARVFSGLAESVADCGLVMGTTRRTSKYREEFLYPKDLGGVIAARSGQLKTALVFGREDQGLKTSELDLCQLLITIPTRKSLPSMNLAQAAALCLYEAASPLGALDFAPENIPVRAESRDLEAMFLQMEKTLLDLGFLDRQNPKHLMRAFRRMFGRQGLDEREVRILRGLWNKIDWLQGEYRRSLGLSGEKPQGG